MPHIHTGPNQHDMTVSAYIIREDGEEPRMLVHMHRKFGKLMQIGGHIELDETPWQSVAHEIAEESGYTVDDLQVLQPDRQPVVIKGAVTHPVPVILNTYKLPNAHYHSDLSYAFVTDRPPSQEIADGESGDLRWLTQAALQRQAEEGVAAKDVAIIYGIIIERYLDAYYRIPADHYSLDKPYDASL